MMDEEPEYLSSATLIITSDDLIPQNVTEQLGLKPNKSWRKGEQKTVVLSNGILKFNSVYEWGGWKCFLPKEIKSLKLAEQLLWWCNTLEGRESVMLELETQGCSLEINCFVSTQATASILLSADLQKRLANLRLDLSFSIFAAETSSSNDIK